MALGSTIKVSFLGDASDLAKAANKASSAVDGVGGAAKKAGKAVDDAGKKGHSLRTAFAGLGGAALGAGLVEFGKKAVDAAVEGQQAHAQLAQAIKNTGGSIEEVEPQVDKLSQRFAKLGFTNDEVEGALATMTTSLGSSQKAMTGVGLAADLARFKHVDLSTASLAVAKAMEGNLRPLKQLGIDLPVAAGGAKAVAQAQAQVTGATQKLNTFLKIHKDAVNANSKQHGVYLQMVDKVHQAQVKLSATQGASTSIVTALAHAVGGQASASAGTYAGKIQAMHAQFANLTEEVGAKLLPAIVKLMDGFSKLSAFVERNRKIVVPLAAALGGLAATVWTITKAAKAYTAVQEALNVVMSLNPIGLVVIAVAALAVGIVVLWKKSETFRTIVTDAFKAVGTAVLTVIDGILWGYQKLAEGAGKLPGPLGAPFRAAADKIAAVRGGISALQTKLDDLGKKTTYIKFQTIGLRAPSAKELAGVGGSKGLTLEGARAAGGPVSAGDAYLVGERGPEVFIPTRSGQVASNASLHLARAQVVEHTTVVKLDTRVIATAVNRFNAQAVANGARLGA